jgi:UDP-N-acetylglucosamine acyltransferase
VRARAGVLSMSIDISRLIRQIPSQYPFVLVDQILEHDGTGLVAVKNVTGSEDFFAGHFPGAPVMPGVLLMESLAQAAGIWLLEQAPDPSALEVHVVGIDDAKFRRPAVPGDRLRLDVRVLHQRGGLTRIRGEIQCEGNRVAEGRLLLQVREGPGAVVDASARIAPGAQLAPGVRVGPFCTVGPRVRLGRGTILESHVVVDGDTTVGEGNHFFPFVSVGLAPQDLKYRGEPTRVAIGDRNVLRESVTVHRGTAGGGGITRLGNDNLLMAGVHVAHDCQVGSQIIFGNAATLAGHVDVADYAIVNAFSGVHQFCRVGEHSFVGGYTVVTKDVLPFSRVVGNRACIYGVNAIGLSRRGFSPARVKAIRDAFRVLLQSRLNASEAVARLEAAPAPGDDVRGLVAFIRTSRRGVILKRRSRAGEAGDDE